MPYSSAVRWTLAGVTIAVALLSHERHGGAQTSEPQISVPTFKIAFYNIQGGNGERPLPGVSCPFTENPNCTDPSRPLNAWGRGVVQAELRRAIGRDESVVALGLAEAWGCATARAVQRTLGWPARTETKNGVAVVARYGFAGPETWRELDTSRAEEPEERRWMVRVPVCLDAPCSRSVPLFATHSGNNAVVYADSLLMSEWQTRDQIDFAAESGAGQPHVMVGDFNAWEGSSRVCYQSPRNDPPRMLREAGYVDGWRAVHGSAEGFTGMWNRRRCGTPEGYLWKRIDYAWSQGLSPMSMERFGMVEPGQCAPSDHAGIVAEYAMPDPLSGVPPAVAIRAPVTSASDGGDVPVSVDAATPDGVLRVELIVDGVVQDVRSAEPFDFTWSTGEASRGAHRIEAAVTSMSGHRTVSAPVQVTLGQGDVRERLR